MQIQRVRDLTPQELSQIYLIHRNILKESFLNNFGQDFLKIVYQYLPKSRNNIFLILKSSDRVVGFGVATKNSNFVSEVIQNNFFTLTIAVAKAVLINAGLLFKITPWLFQSKKTEKFPSELLFLAIDKDYQGQGYGTEFIKKFYEEFRKEKIKYFKVGTKSNNPKSNEFYKKLKFSFLAEIEIFGDNFNYYLSPKTY
jgi:ribosomal protein S18 acetylase RimI-like enzyme